MAPPRKENPKSVKVEFRLTPEEADRLRGQALAAGFGRKIPDSDPPRKQGDISAFVFHLFRQVRRSEMISRLRGHPEIGRAPRRQQMVKIELRVTELLRRGMRRIAEEAGFLHGGRGNVSAFIRAVVRMECGLLNESEAAKLKKKREP